MTDVTDFAAPFWEGLTDDEIRLPECRACGMAVFPPGPLCPDCGSDDLVWTEVEPTGDLHSFTRQHRTAPGFDSPIVMGMVDLDAGPRLLAPIEAAYDSLSIGDRVRIEATDYDADYDRGRRAGEPFFHAVVVDTDD